VNLPKVTRNKMCGVTDSRTTRACRTYCFCDSVVCLCATSHLVELFIILFSFMCVLCAACVCVDEVVAIHICALDTVTNVHPLIAVVSYSNI